MQHDFGHGRAVFHRSACSVQQVNARRFSADRDAHDPSWAEVSIARELHPGDLQSAADLEWHVPQNLEAAWKRGPRFFRVKVTPDLLVKAAEIKRNNRSCLLLFVRERRRKDQHRQIHQNQDNDEGIRLLSPTNAVRKRFHKTSLLVAHVRGQARPRMRRATHSRVSNPTMAQSQTQVSHNG